MTDVFKIIVKYRHLSPSGNRALENQISLLNFLNNPAGTQYSDFSMETNIPQNFSHMN